MQLAARSMLAAAAALAAGSVIAVTAAVTSSPPDIQTPAVQLTALDDGLSGVVTEVESLFSGSGFNSLSDVLVPAASPSMGLESLLSGFNDNLVTGEFGFNDALTNGELGFENAIFHSDSALNGVFNRSANVFNMFIDANEQGFNGVVGASNADPQALTSSLLLVGTGDPFSDGTIGGFEGMFGQGYMAFTDFLGLLGDPSALVPMDMFNPADFLGAVNPLDFLGI